MSTEHEILMHSFNGTDFDDLYPKSKTNLIEDSNGKNLDELLGDFVIPKDITSTSIASFNDGIDGAILGKCVVNIEPVQAGSGYPSPTNVRSISGWTEANINVVGKNLLYPKTTLYLNFSGTANIGYDIISDDYQAIGIIYVKGMSSVTISGDLSELNSSTFRYVLVSSYPAAGLPVLASGTVVTGETITIPNEAKYLLWSTGWSKSQMISMQGTPYFTLHNVMINSGDTPLEYSEPASKYSISFGEAGTVYGGILDVGNGVLTVDRVKKPLISSFDWRTFASAPDMRYATTNATDIPASAIENSIKCDRLGSTTQAGIVYHHVNYGITVYGGQIGCILTGNESLDDFKSIMADAYVVYYLATPQTYQLTTTQVRTLLGENNIYADCGNIEIEYRGDIPNIYNYANMVAAANAVAGAGVAPGGFGLGASAVLLTNANDLNDITSNGFYSWRDGSVNRPSNFPSDITNPVCSMIVSKHTVDYVVQTVTILSGNYLGTIMRRTRRNSRWNDWEYINPPLVADTEYRTTERFLGKPVYVKMFDVGAWGQTVDSYVTVNYPANTDRIVEAHIYDSEGRLHDYDSYSIYTVFAKTKGIIRTVNVDTYITSTTCSVLLKYTKT